MAAPVIPRVIHHAPTPALKPKFGYTTLCLMLAWAALEVVSHDDFVRVDMEQASGATTEDAMLLAIATGRTRSDEVVGHDDFLRIANLRCEDCLRLCGGISGKP